MTTDLESAVREDLAARAEDAHVSVDLDGVLASGRRTLARRRLLGTAAAASVVAIAAVAGALLPRGGLVAVPADATPAVTTPAVTFDMELDARLDRPWTAADPQSISVIAQATPDGGYRITFSGVSQTGAALPSGGGDLAPGTGATWSSSSVYPGYVLGVVRGDATSIFTTPEGGGVSSIGDHRRLPGTDLTAFFTRYADASYPAKVSRLVWIDADRTVHDSDGATLPSAVLGTGDRSSLAFVDTKSGMIGWGAEGVVYTKRGAQGEIKGGSWNSGSGLGWSWAVLPRGAHDIKADFRPGVTDRRVDVATDVGPDRLVFVAISGIADKSAAANFLTRLTWLDAAGRPASATGSK